MALDILETEIDKLIAEAVAAGNVHSYRRLGEAFREIATKTGLGAGDVSEAYFDAIEVHLGN